MRPFLVSTKINFFSLREKVTKRGKKLAVLSLYHFCLKPERARLSPHEFSLVPHKNYAEPRGEIPLHKFSMVCKRAISANSLDYWCVPFCRERKICKPKKCAVVPSKFYSLRIKFQLGEAQEVLVYSRTDKAR